VPRRWVRIVLIVVAIAIALSIAGYVVFNLGEDSPPETGTGEVITEPSP
jgi:methanogenic corrinoid protein MtbC1